MDVQLVDVSDNALPGLLLLADSGVTEEQVTWFALDSTVTPYLGILLQPTSNLLLRACPERLYHFAPSEAFSATSDYDPRAVCFTDGFPAQDQGPCASQPYMDSRLHLQE